MSDKQDIDQIAAEAAEMWFIGEDALGRKRQDQGALRDIIQAAIEKARLEWVYQNSLNRSEPQSDDTKRLDWLGRDYTGFDDRISLIWEGRKNGMGFREAIDASMRKDK